MSIQTDIASLIATTNAMLQAVNASKTTLDTSIDSAVSTATAQAQAAATTAQIASLTVGVYPPSSSTVVPHGVTATTGLVAGSGGANGIFALGVSGGGATIAATGTFTVSGGLVSDVTITSPGYGYTSAPTISFSASSGLTGASVSAITGNTVTVGQGYWALSSDGQTLQRYHSDGSNIPVIDVGISVASATAINQLKTTLHTYDGVSGITLTDVNGNEIGFFPFDDNHSTQLPFLNASATRVKSGPLSVFSSAGEDGISIVDTLGNETAFIPTNTNRALSLPYLKTDEQLFQAGPLKAVAVDGSTGVAFVDSLGNEVAYIPFGDQALRLPYVRANASTLMAGPLAVRLIEGVDGIVFVDSLGNGVSPPTSAPSGSATAALDKAATLKLSRPSNSVVTQGHSKTQQCSWGGTVNPTNPNGGTARKADIGWLAWADYYLRGSINWLWNAGVGGETDAQIVSRMTTDVIAKDPAWCFMMGGTCNSINAGRSAAEIISTQIGTETADSGNSMLGLLQNAGIRTVWLTDPTWYTGHNDLTAANVTKLNQVNRAIARAPGYKNGLVAIDAAALVVDPTQTDGRARQYYLQGDDNIHPSPLGARAIGRVMANRLLDAGFPMQDILVSSAADTYAVSPASKQLIDNPLMALGTGGTVSTPSVVSGSAPEGWRVVTSGTWGSNFVTSSLVPRSDGYGNDWVITVTNTGADGDLLTLVGPDVRNRLVSGDIIEGAAQVDITGMSRVKGHELRIDLAATAPINYTAVSTLERDAEVNSGLGWGYQFYDQADLVGGVMKTGKASVPSGTLESYSGSMRLRITFGGSGGTAIIKISRAQLLKNS